MVAQGELGELALVDVLDHRDRRTRLALGGRLEPPPHVRPDDLAVLADVALVVLVGVALAVHQLAQELDALREVSGVRARLDAADRVLVGGVAQHLEDRSVHLDCPPVGPDAHDADGGSLEDRSEAHERLHLLALGLKLRRVAHGRGDHDGEELEGADVLVVERLRALREHQQRAHGLPGVQQRDRDHRAHAGHSHPRGVHALVGQGVVADQRPPVADRPPAEAVVQVEQLARVVLGGPVGGAEAELAVLEQRNGSALGAGQLHRARAEQVHQSTTCSTGRAPGRSGR